MASITSDIASLMVLNSDVPQAAFIAWAQQVEQAAVSANLVLQDWTNTPPVSPVSGQIWATGSTPTGVWAGKANMLAWYVNGAGGTPTWVYFAPQTGWHAYIVTGAADYIFGGATWTAIAYGGGGGGGSYTLPASTVSALGGVKIPVSTTSGLTVAGDGTLTESPTDTAKLISNLALSDAGLLALAEKLAAQMAADPTSVSSLKGSGIGGNAPAISGAAVSHALGAAYYAIGVVWNGATFIAAGQNGNVSTSAAGLVWVWQGNKFAGATPTTIAAVGSVAVASFNTSAIYTTTDGVTWTLRSNFLGGASANVISNGTTFLAYNATNVWTSTDGVAWSSLHAHGAATVSTYPIYANGNWYIYPSGTTTVRRSPDGITWSSYGSANIPPSGPVAYANGVFVGVDGTSSLNMASIDGINFTDSPGTIGGAPTAARSIFFAGGQASADGRTFWSVGIPSGSGAPFGAATNGTTIIVVPQSTSNIIYSLS